MNNLDDVYNSGVTVDMTKLPTGFCLLSLKTALKSYFESLDSLGRGFGNPIRSNLTSKVDISKSTEFYLKSGETILHFHHFFELLIKDILRQKHALLSNVASDNDIIFYKLLFNESISQETESNLKTIEFDRTIKRFFRLLNEGFLDSKYNFLDSHKETLNKLNILRNRLWHRGLYLLDYEGLDLFLGKYILPIIQELVNKTDYLNDTDIWKYRELHCKIDPILEIIQELSGSNYEITTIGFLKELGRASYENPLRYEHIYELVDGEHSAIANYSAKFQAEHYNQEIIKTCPVCGDNTLLIKNALDGGPEEEKKFLVEFEARCTLCTFSLSNRFRVPEKYNDKITIWN